MSLDVFLQHKYYSQLWLIDFQWMSQMVAYSWCQMFGDVLNKISYYCFWKIPKNIKLLIFHIDMKAAFFEVCISGVSEFLYCPWPIFFFCESLTSPPSSSPSPSTFPHPPPWEFLSFFPPQLIAVGQTDRKKNNNSSKTQ